ncbi:HK97 family phage major capsid protein [Kribbella aluminosa]|uniref:HK97 family phage major capsid protein n=1 Tax=Kribbella aluminosa TaxID=416017 RepID=A0ABS4UYS7_9ACTN|nr:phage major capsid protein [Kribbella aluminosa]MBP2356803.1 HK97 family phage major capsid protein [Kribbella aluminosa]
MSSLIDQYLEERGVNNWTPGQPLLPYVLARRDAVAACLRDMERRGGDGSPESRQLKRAATEGRAYLSKIDERIAELEEIETRNDATAKHNVEIRAHEGRGYVTDAAVYNDPHKVPDSPSFFRDMRSARLGDADAADRLRRNTAARGLETRVGDMSTGAGTGGQFAPPAWLVDEFVALARAGRVTADLMHKEPLPSGVSSINLPTVASGTSTAVQATQNTVVQDTAATTNAVSSGITTVAGKQIVSLQLLQQSGIPFDRVVLGDLSADYARTLDVQVLTGSGASGQLRGLANAAGITTVAYTTATPKVIDATTPANSLYNAIVRGVNSVATQRFMPPTAIVMHPQRWSWILEALDSSSRPLVLSQGGAFNPLGVAGEVVAQGQAGVLLGLPVYVDPNIPTNLGAGTNQDAVWVLRADDCNLYESPLALESFEATYADQASVLFRALSYSAFIPDRYGKSLALISGTGLVTPTL